MSLFLSKIVGEHSHSENTIPSFSSLSLEGSAHPTFTFNKFFNGNTWVENSKGIYKYFVNSILSFLSFPPSPPEPKVTKVDSRNKNIKPFFCEITLLDIISGKIHDVFYYAFFNGLLSTFFSQNNTQNNTKSVMFANVEVAV